VISDEMTNQDNTGNNLNIKRDQMMPNRPYRIIVKLGIIEADKNLK